ncbi:flagellar protein FlaG [Treponema berlinense]|uniref:Flagellar protein FlaG n=1 Tax=Treponema berlinense TaxID=225004 RepID=A0A1T4KC06_9SPIR|nr:flagellar protein FlaG [Treponema berlinense]SJZ39941.1 flagellar protein FlaG [Treponema berlinense]
MTISSIGQPAMDGRILANSANASASKTSQRPEVKMPMADAAQVVQNISDKNAQLQEDVRQLQKLSDVVSGRKVQFSVNKELNQVVVTVVDSKTDKVIKQIPSEDIQKLKVRIRKAIGVLFDEMI